MTQSGRTTEWHLISKYNLRRLKNGSFRFRMDDERGRRARCGIRTTTSRSDSTDGVDFRRVPALHFFSYARNGRWPVQSPNQTNQIAFNFRKSRRIQRVYRLKGTSKYSYGKRDSLGNRAADMYKRLSSVYR